MDMVWDTKEDADEFVDAFTAYANLRWESSSSQIDVLPTWSGENGAVVLMRDYGRTLWVMAPETEIVDSILDELK